MAKNWESIKEGFVLRGASGLLVWDILANGHPENPVIYFTEYLWEAKAWKTEKAAFKAAGRIRGQAGICDVLYFEYNEETAAREIKATVY